MYVGPRLCNAQEIVTKIFSSTNTEVECGVLVSNRTAELTVEVLQHLLLNKSKVNCYCQGMRQNSLFKQDCGVS